MIGIWLLAVCAIALVVCAVRLERVLVVLRDILSAVSRVDDHRQ